MNKFYLLLSVFLVSCISTEKYNQHIISNISTKKLKTDVDFVKKKLLSHHTDIDMYLPKENLIFKLDSLKNSINQPMKPNDFGRELSKVIAQFGHGHTYIKTLIPKISKQEKKRLKGTLSPFNQLITKSVGDKILLKNIQTKQKTEDIYAELIAIDSLTFSDFAKKHKGFRRGDGKIRTMDNLFLNETFVSYAGRELGVKDSITLILRKKDSIFTKIVKRDFPIKTEKISKTQNETQPKILTKEEKEKLKKQAKYRENIKKYFGYDEKTKEYTRNITFPVKEDSSIAVLSIKKFHNGGTKKAYQFIFDSIQKANIQHLILDLRDNGGGSLRNGNFLYSYLTKTDKPVVDNSAKVSSKFAVAKNRLSVFKNFNILTYTFGILPTISLSINNLIKTKKGKDGEYYYHFNLKKSAVKNPYTGNLYILTNGGSYSMSAILSASLQGENRGIFVGEETGGDYNGTVAGKWNCNSLTNSKLDICYGIMTLKPNNQRTLKGRGILPDFPISQDFDAVMDKKDPQLEFLINKIMFN